MFRSHDTSLAAETMVAPPFSIFSDTSGKNFHAFHQGNWKYGELSQPVRYENEWESMFNTSEAKERSVALLGENTILFSTPNQEDAYKQYQQPRLLGKRYLFQGTELHPSSPEYSTVYCWIPRRQNSWDQESEGSPVKNSGSPRRVWYVLTELCGYG